MVRPHDLPNTSDYHIFKDGIKPMWEDDANRWGGKWLVRLKKGLATKYWEDLVRVTHSLTHSTACLMAD
jgi:translation initiation factor 4E